MNHLSMQDMFECRIGSYERGSHLVNQTCVGPGEVFVDTVENFQLEEDFLNAVDAAQGIRKVKARMGDDVGVAYIGFGVADVDA
ncbi:hypothetical protein FRC0406_00455 [Corynebacterium diphtheriae]|nr:hypothetical protein FRC0406_00455 [Corynebacterium diphtheriae]CAB0947998.1 hypothetical protein FRC0470_00884 [Corynebacterium diphtheriae]